MRPRSGYVYKDKTSGAWIARTTVTDETGKRRNVKRQGETKAAAKRLLKALLRDIENEGSRVIDATRMTFDNLADHYELHYLKPAQFVDGRKVNGLRDWKHASAFLRIFRNHFGKRRLREITYADIRTFSIRRLNTPTQYGRQRSITTVNRELSYLRRILNIGVRESWLVKNPFNAGDGLISTADERKRERILTLDEENRLLKACENPWRSHLRPLLICLLDTGARFSEMTQLRWRSVCLDSGIITIEGRTTKTLKTRHVAITERMSTELHTLRESRSIELEARVFGVIDNVRKSFASACKEAGIKSGGIDGLTIHSLRHTAATRLVKGNLPLQMVGRILGHSQVGTTYRYVTANSETIAQAASILEDFQAKLAEPSLPVSSPLIN